MHGTFATSASARNSTEPPQSSRSTTDSARQRRADARACREAIRIGSRSFHAASLLLPPRVRESALSLYAFCRLSDDLVDGQGEGVASSGRATSVLLSRLDAAYADIPFDHPADRAFARTVREHAIPKAVPLALLEGFTWDEQGRRYETIADLHEYGMRVAATVGVMMTLVMGCRDPKVLARATDLGLAMQLTNIARDVGEDARNGRVYLPTSWLGEAGIEPEQLISSPAYDKRLAGVVARLLDEADRLYRRASTGVGSLPPGCRGAIGAALRIYREIGVEIGRASHDSVSRRARTSGRRKLALAMQAKRDRFFAPALDHSPAMPQVRPLLDAVAAHELPAQAVTGKAARALGVLGALTLRERRLSGL